MNTSARNIQLQKLGEQFSLIGKAIRIKYGGSMVCTTPVLDKVLIVIGSEPEGGMNIKHLAALLLVTSGAATQHVAALEEAGAVTRVISHQDRREIIVQLTPKGHEMYQKIKKNSLQVLHEIFDDLDDTELETFTQLMTKASNKYQTEGAKHDR